MQGTNFATFATMGAIYVSGLCLKPAGEASVSKQHNNSRQRCHGNFRAGWPFDAEGAGLEAHYKMDGDCSDSEP